MVSKKSLNELLRDEEEIRDLLEAYGLADLPEDGRKLRKLLMEQIQGIGETRLLSTLFEFAKGFARMSQEIMDYCESKGVGIAGQIQVKTENIFLEKSALNTGWVFEKEPLQGAHIEERASALASAIEDLGLRLEPKEFVNVVSEEYETEIGRGWRNSPNPQHQVYRQVMRNLAYRTRHFEAITAGDYKSLTSVLDLIGDVQAGMVNIPLPSGVASGFDNLTAHCTQIIQEMSQWKIIEDDDRINPLIATISDELVLLSRQVQSLVEDVAHAQRANEGFQDFTRTEFWFQRWRIYELWLLVRILKVIERAGGEVNLIGVEATVWNLRYGRATEPIATCLFPKGSLNVYYQLFRESGAGADMPDIAVLPTEGRGLLVLDPKHGYSYTRHKVQKVLTRYAQNLDADMTAIVNYFPIQQYAFDFVRWDTRRWLLAADIAPLTNTLERMEHHFADVLLSRGFRRRMVSTDRPEQAIPKIPPKAAALLYWANREREVDEPNGAWLLGAGGGLAPAPQFSELLGDFGGSIIPSPTGENCLIYGEGLFLIGSTFAPKRIPAPGSSIIAINWNSPGTSFCLQTKEKIFLYDKAGVPTDEFDLPVAGGEVVNWSENESGLLYTHNTSEAITMYGLIDKKWELLFQHKQSSYYKSYDANIIDLGFNRGLAIVFSAYEAYILRGGVVEKEEENFLCLSVSPSGRYSILEGPTSLRRDQDITLLQVKENRGDAQEVELPLVRFSGKLSGKIRWSPDETRFAFKATRGPDSKRPEQRLLVARVGERYAMPVSLPGQYPDTFGWISHAIVNRISK